MTGDMKFEESSLTGYLVKNLQPLTEADPEILAKYVTALLKKDKPTTELQKLCAENLTDFLGQDTKSFITKLFQALEDGTISSSAENLQNASHNKIIGASLSAVSVDVTANNGTFPITVKAETHSDREEKEASDDDDDDRNHKHRRRETRSLSSEKGGQGSYLGRANREKGKLFENGQTFAGQLPKQYHVSPLDGRGKFEKQQFGIGSLSKTPLDLGQRMRGPLLFPAPRFDPSGRAAGKGRGRGSVTWTQHESRFASVESFDYASQVAPQVAAPSLFPSSVQSAPWTPFGLVHGMPTASLDALHPLSLHGTFRPPVNASLNVGIPRQRCRDFEERGFCLSGDMCPMEHGVNRIVVEDVQSLSQFNLPVSIPSAQLLGIQGGAGAAPPLNISVNMSLNDSILQSRCSKSMTANENLGPNGKLSNSCAVGDIEFYDPDQPLWSNDELESAARLLKSPSRVVDESEPVWKPNLCGKNTRPEKSMKCSTSSSIWSRIRNSDTATETVGMICSARENDTKDDNVEANVMCDTTSLLAWTLTKEEGATARTANNSDKTGRTDSIHKEGGKYSQRASRTLYVSGIPVDNNKRGVLLSHFKKFGEVVDIYISHNKGKAFVQFARREEAEAALRAPDAVMGNRFIKLWWANRDRVPLESSSSQNCAYTALGGSPRRIPRFPIDKTQENLLSSVKMEVCPVASTTPISACTLQKPLIANGSKAIPLQKKMENLELLKEELRKKQEMLDQKRNDFRRQLNKLEKQAITAKGEKGLELAAKRQKADVVSTDENTVVGQTAVNSIDVTAAKLDSEKDESSHSGEIMPSYDNSKKESITHQEGVAYPHISECPRHISSSLFHADEVERENQPATFRIIPPLPPDFASVAAVEEHFSLFGDLSLIEIEDMNSCGNGSSKLSQISAFVTFKSRESAVKAFQSGRNWKGYNLLFAWSSSSASKCGGVGTEKSSAAIIGTAISEVEIAGSSFLGTEAPPCHLPVAGTSDHLSSMHKEQLGSCSLYDGDPNKLKLVNVVDTLEIGSTEEEGSGVSRHSIGTSQVAI